MEARRAGLLERARVADIVSTAISPTPPRSRRTGHPDNTYTGDHRDRSVCLTLCNNCNTAPSPSTVHVPLLPLHPALPLTSTYETDHQQLIAALTELLMIAANAPKIVDFSAVVAVIDALPHAKVIKAIAAGFVSL